MRLGDDGNPRRRSGEDPVAAGDHARGGVARPADLHDGSRSTSTTRAGLFRPGVYASVTLRVVPAAGGVVIPLGRDRGDRGRVDGGRDAPGTPARARLVKISTSPTTTARSRAWSPAVAAGDVLAAQDRRRDRGRNWWCGRSIRRRWRGGRAGAARGGQRRQRRRAAPARSGATAAGESRRWARGGRWWWSRSWSPARAAPPRTRRRCQFDAAVRARDRAEPDRADRRRRDPPRASGLPSRRRRRRCRSSRGRRRRSPASRATGSSPGSAAAGRRTAAPRRSTLGVRRWSTRRRGRTGDRAADTAVGDGGGGGERAPGRRAMACARAYIAAMTAERLVTVAQDARDAARSHRRYRDRGAAAAAVGTDLDVVRAQSELATDEALVASAMTARLRAEEALGVKSRRPRTLPPRGRWRAGAGSRRRGARGRQRARRRDRQPPPEESRRRGTPRKLGWTDWAPRCGSPATRSSADRPARSTRSRSGATSSTTLSLLVVADLRRRRPRGGAQRQRVAVEAEAQGRLCRGGARGALGGPHVGGRTRLGAGRGADWRRTARRRAGQARCSNLAQTGFRGGTSTSPAEVT